MTDDIPKTVIEETDIVSERIFSEWDKWLEGFDDPRKLELRDWQNEVRALENKLVDATDDMKLELQENITVIKKKMKKQVMDLLAEMKPAPEPKKHKRKRRR